ncbi:MAG TPA: glycosyltransferase family 39 protein, partial [Phycisphaerae bacterium]|nr:glycosyltransferase family 39 protein [Phycisphaerae bacterium]
MKSPRLRADPKTFASDGFRFGAGTLAAGLLLIAAVFAAHFPAIHAGYIWDDDAFLYQNPIIMAPDGLYRFWFTTEASDYWPLTHTMFWLEWRIWGDNPMPYHVGNIILHAVAVLLLWRVFARLGLDEIGAYLAAMIFAVHPVTVESVAWISERKNVLSLSLYLLSILAYFRFEDRGSRRWYVLALLAAAAALLAKVSVMTLPVVLLLCAWWRRGSLTGRDILRTLPFFAMSLAMGLLEIWFVGQQASISGEVPRPEGFLSRIAASGWIVWFYLYKTLLPLNLSMVYPRWNVDGGNILSFVPLALLIGCFVVLWRRRTGWGRAPLAALGYFVITLGPVLGFMDMSFALYSLVADHLQYPAMPGIVALAGGWLGIAVRRVRQGSS